MGRFIGVELDWRPANNGWRLTKGRSVTKQNSHIPNEDLKFLEFNFENFQQRKTVNRVNSALWVGNSCHVIKNGFFSF